MACESEWDAYQQAIADRIASEIVEAAAIAARQAAQEAEWTACMAWWYCGQQGLQAAVDGPTDRSIPSLKEAQAGFRSAAEAFRATQARLEQLYLQYERVTGKAYESGK